MNLEARVVKLLPKRKDCRTKRPYLNGLPPQFGSTFFSHEHGELAHVPVLGGRGVIYIKLLDELVQILQIFQRAANVQQLVGEKVPGKMQK